MSAFLIKTIFLTVLLKDVVGLKGHSKTGQRRGHTKFPEAAGFFGDFSLGESTHTYDGTLANRNQNPMVNVLDGWNPQMANPPSKSVRGPAWFHETRSGGWKAAWQSFYPPMQDSLPGNQMPNGNWFTGTGGVWQQNYQSSAALSSDHKEAPASWFDDFVNQIDEYGRLKYPGYGEANPRWYLYWEERSVNTTIKCEKPGCTARSTLTAPFDPDKEIVKNCRLTASFHPTDFDDQYSGEMIEYVQVNGRQLASNCRPMQHGCNATAFRPLIPCVEDTPVDMIMKKNRAFVVEARIPEVVDECMYEGNLLSGVSVLTCLVRPKTPPPPPPPPPEMVQFDQECHIRAPLQCPTRGCEAEVVVPIGEHCANNVGNCMMSIFVNQTDYDNKDFTVESIEYIKVAGDQLVTNVKPGLNPCKAAWYGKPDPDSKLIYKAVTDHKLTNIANGTVLVQGKISQYVDECASNGYLFDAWAEVTCHAKDPKALATLEEEAWLTQGKDKVHRRQLRGHGVQSRLVG